MILRLDLIPQEKQTSANRKLNKNNCQVFLHSLKCTRQDDKSAVSTKHVERVRNYPHLSPNPHST